MKIRLICGSKNGEVMIVPDDTLMLVFPIIDPLLVRLDQSTNEVNKKPEIKYEKYLVSGYGFALLMVEK